MKKGKKKKAEKKYRVLSEYEIMREIERLRDEGVEEVVIIGKDENGELVVYDGGEGEAKVRGGGKMKVKYLGHASFLLETSDGVKIITDPYESGSFGGEVRYKPITEEANIVLISHEHADHNYTKSIKGKPTILRKPGDHKVGNINFKGILTYHDETKGSQRGTNIVFKFTADGINFAHLGDLGEIISEDVKKQIVPVDVIFIPVGGVFTIDANGANKICNMLNPKIIIPMHFKTSGIGFPLASVSDFTRNYPKVKEVGSYAEITLPTEQEVWVFQPALI